MEITIIKPLKKLKVLVACEESQVVCKAFREKGHEAYSCDIQECSGGHPEWHIHDDVLKHLNDGWDIMIAHPPCTRLANSGVRWLHERYLWRELKQAIQFFNEFKKANCKVAIENPIPHHYAKKGFYISELDDLSREELESEGIGEYNQLIQPWQFGHGETKATCLWLKGLPKLKPTNIVEGREQRIWKMPPVPDRTKLRSKTFLGIAKAMADQYSRFIENGMSVEEWG